MKLKVTATTFFDKKEQKYIYKKDTPTIEREEERAKQLIAAGVCEELDEDSDQGDESMPEPQGEPTEKVLEEAMPEPEDKEAEKPKKKK